MREVKKRLRILGRKHTLSTIKENNQEKQEDVTKKSSSRKGRKSNLEVALNSIMTGFASSNEAIEQKQM
jgi:hypothetical protein